MASQDMMKILADECKKPGLKNWVGINTDIRIQKLNATWLNICKYACQLEVILTWICNGERLLLNFAGEDLFCLLQTRFIALGEMPSQRQQWVFQEGFSKTHRRIIILCRCSSKAGSLYSNIWMLIWFSQKSFVNTSSPMCWQIFLVLSSELLIEDPTGGNVKTTTFAASSRSTFALKSLPRDRFWF